MSVKSYTIEILSRDKYFKFSLVLGCLIGVLYLYLCFAYNLQFYTEDERYIQKDMTRLESLYQWNMGVYRVSSSFGSFLYYPLLSASNGMNAFLQWISDGKTKIIPVPMMMSKLVHSFMSMAGWLAVFILMAAILNRHMKLPGFLSVIGFAWIAMLPVNIFLVKINNYDSLYNILSIIGLLLLYHFIRGRSRKILFLSFLFFSMAVQEKFAAVPVFIFCLFFSAFFLGKNSSETIADQVSFLFKDILLILVAIWMGSVLPTIVRILAEFIWHDSTLAISRIGTYDPFKSMSKSLTVLQSYGQIGSRLLAWMARHVFLSISICFVIWALIIESCRYICIQGNIVKVIAKFKRATILSLGIIQILYFLWCFVPDWYTPPPAGIYPYDKPPEGTFVPTIAYGDDRYGESTFYYGAGQLEYIFIRLVKTGGMGFFREGLYTPVLLFLLIGPLFNILFCFSKNNGENILYASSWLVISTMIISVAVLASGVPFTGRYTNIYQTFLSLAAFLNFTYFCYFVFNFTLESKHRMFIMAGTLSVIFCLCEIIPYGPSYQSFGNIFYPVKTTYGWGEATSALVQASRKEPHLKNYLEKAYTTYTGLAIEKPFFSHLVNLRLIRSKVQKGQIRKIRYLLVESCALSQNKWLQKVMDVARKVPGAIIWEWKYPEDTSAWLIEMEKVGFPEFEKWLNPDKHERHYIGEWEF